MFDLFCQGGPVGMSLLTVELICMLFAAWKAPAWVKEIGLLALVTGIFFPLLGVCNALTVLYKAGDVSPMLVVVGLRMALIPLMYGLAVYALSLILRIVQKPRI